MAMLVITQRVNLHFFTVPTSSHCAGAAAVAFHVQVWRIIREGAEVCPVVKGPGEEGWDYLWIAHLKCHQISKSDDSATLYLTLYRTLYLT